MINLLPPKLKEDYRYARRNRHLIHWASAFGAALIISVLITAGGLFYMHTTTTNYEKQVATSDQQLQAQNLSGIQKNVTEISNNLQLVVQVLGKEVLFSQLLKRLGSVTPSNVILTDLTISQTQGAIDVTAQTASYDAATQLQINLADPANQIFSKADIVSVNCGAKTANSQYPCTATLRALFATDNPFLFINGAKKAAS